MVWLIQCAVFLHFHGYWFWLAFSSETSIQCAVHIRMCLLYRNSSNGESLHEFTKVKIYLTPQAKASHSFATHNTDSIVMSS